MGVWSQSEAGGGHGLHSAVENWWARSDVRGPGKLAMELTSQPTALNTRKPSSKMCGHREQSHLHSPQGGTCRWPPSSGQPDLEGS